MNRLVSLCGYFDTENEVRATAMQSVSPFEAKL